MRGINSGNRKLIEEFVESLYFILFILSFEIKQQFEALHCILLNVEAWRLPNFETFLIIDRTHIPILVFIVNIKPREIYSFPQLPSVRLIQRQPVQILCKIFCFPGFPFACEWWLETIHISRHGLKWMYCKLIKNFL